MDANDPLGRPVLEPCPGCSPERGDAETQRLTGRLRGAVEVLVRRFAIAERADVACCGMTVAQAATLTALRTSGPLRLGDLGRRLGISPSTLTRNLARLEERGLVERLADPEDSRSSRAALTARGRAASADVEEREEAFARSVLARIPQARRGGTVEALERVLDAIREATDACCPGAFDHLMPPSREESRRPKGAR